jgi:hypothetical protein
MFLEIIYFTLSVSKTNMLTNLANLPLFLIPVISTQSFFDAQVKTGGFRGTQLFQLFTKANNLPHLLWFLQNLFVLLEKGNYQDIRNERYEKLQKFSLRIEEVFKEMPQLQVRLYKRKSGSLLLKRGATNLDKILVNDVLDWLDGYPDVKKHYQNALEMVMENEPAKFRNLLDNLRLALELLLKTIMKNNQRLEEQGKPLKEWLTQKGVQDKIRLMFTDFLGRDRFTELMNEAVKHGDRKWHTAEVEFLVYQTGVFFRFLIELNQLSSHEENTN